MTNAKKIVNKVMIALLAVVMVVASLGFAASMLEADDNSGISMNTDVQAVSNVSSDENQEIVNSGDLNIDFTASVARADYNIEGTITTVNGFLWTQDRLEIDVHVTDAYGNSAYCPGLLLTIVCHDRPSPQKTEKKNHDLSNTSHFITTFQNGWNAVDFYQVTFSIGDKNLYDAKLMV